MATYKIERILAKAIIDDTEGHEISRILLELSKDCALKGSGVDRTLMDINGNKIGRAIRE